MRRVAALTVLFALGLTGVAFAVFSATTTNGTNAFAARAADDATAPTVSRAIAARPTGATPAGRIRQGGDYYVYAQVADAVAVSGVAVNASSFDSGVTLSGLKSAGGPWTVGGQSYNYRSVKLTANTPLTTGTSYAYTVYASDPAGNGSSLGATVAIETYPQVLAATTGLVSYWRMNDGAVAADEFTDTAGTALTGHTGAVGTTWTRWVNDSITAVVSDANRLRRDASAGGVAYSASAAPSSANYQVSADLTVKSLLATDYAGVSGRWDLSATTGSGTFYAARYSTSASRWELLKSVNGTGTLLGSYSQTLAAGTTYRVTLDMSGSTISLSVDGVQRATASDASIAAAGRAGVRLGASGATSGTSDTTGLHLDNFKVITPTTTMADSAGANTGTSSNTPTLDEPGALVGDSDRATDFNGSNQYVTVPDANSLDVGDTFTLEAWVKRGSIQSSWHNIFQRGATSWQLGFLDSDFLLTRSTVGINAQYTTNGDLTAYHHYVAVRDGAAGATRLYLDGVDVTPASTSNNAMSNTSTPLYIAALNTSSQFLDATLDELAVYSTALSPATIQDHYLAGRGTG